MLDRRRILAGLGMTTIATIVSGRLGAASPIKPDNASALLVIDVQNCFLPGGSLAVKDGDQVVPVINRIAKGRNVFRRAQKVLRVVRAELYGKRSVERRVAVEMSLRFG